MDIMDKLNMELGIGPARPRLPKELIDRGYKAIKLVGKGSFGSANLVYNERTLLYSIAKEVNLTSMSVKQRGDAEKEIFILSSLSHPNIIRYEECFLDADKVIFIIMEYADGGDLESKIRMKSAVGGSFRPAETARIFGQICLAIKYLHSRRILHRDLKSQNVFMTKSGVVKLGDFGISTVLQNSVMMAKTICGTPYYFSPELCRGHAYNNKSDIWALGCLLYELLCLDLPFKARDMTNLMKRILGDPSPRLPRACDVRWQTLLDQLLAKEPEARPEITGVLRCSLLRDMFGKIADDFEKAAKEEEKGGTLRLSDEPPHFGRRAPQPADAQKRSHVEAQPLYGRRAPSPTTEKVDVELAPANGRRSRRSTGSNTPVITPKHRAVPEPVARREVPAAACRSVVAERPARPGGAGYSEALDAGRQPGADAEDDARHLLSNLDAMIGAASGDTLGASRQRSRSPAASPRSDASSDSMPQQTAVAGRVADEYRSVAELFRRTVAEAAVSTPGSRSPQAVASGAAPPPAQDDMYASGPPVGTGCWCDGWASGVDLTQCEGADDDGHVVIQGSSFTLSQKLKRSGQGSSADAMSESNCREGWRAAAQHASSEQLAADLEEERRRNAALCAELEALRRAHQAPASSKALEEERQRNDRLQRQLDEVRTKVLTLTEENLSLRRQVAARK